MRLYHFTNAPHGLDNLQQKRLKIATIEQLNDPFELLGVASQDAAIRERYKKLKQGLADYMGLLCFSANWSNPVQWSHYADHHRGICLGFDVSPDAQITKVRYAKRRLIPNLNAMESEVPSAEKHVRELLSLKFSHWRYEQEHRLFVKLDEKDEATGHYFFAFGDVLRLREVIVGVNSEVTRDEVGAVLADFPDAKSAKARLAFRSFKVVKQRSKALWK